VRLTVGSNELADLLQVRGVKANPVELRLQKESSRLESLLDRLDWQHTGCVAVQ
jgi:hypothetical protein